MTSKDEIKKLIFKALKENGGEVINSRNLAEMINRKQNGGFCKILKDLEVEGVIKIEKVGKAFKYILKEKRKKASKPAIKTVAITNIIEQNPLGELILETLKNNGGIVRSIKSLSKMVNESYLDVHTEVCLLADQNLVKVEPIEGAKNSYNIILVDQPQQVKSVVVERQEKKSINQYTIEEKLTEICSDFKTIIDQNKQLERDKDIAIMEYQELKQNYERLLVEFSEMSKKYHTAIAQLGSLELLQNDILMVAEKLKAI